MVIEKQPHVTFALCLPFGFVEHLHRGLVCMQIGFLFLKFFHPVIQRFSIAFSSAQHPVGQGLAAPGKERGESVCCQRSFRTFFVITAIGLPHAGQRESSPCRVYSVGFSELEQYFFLVISRICASYCCTFSFNASASTEVFIAYSSNSFLDILEIDWLGNRLLLFTADKVNEKDDSLI